jgi:hypothetical protein
MDLTIELNICLLPDPELGAKLVAASEQYETCTPHTCIVTLQGNQSHQSNQSNTGDNKETAEGNTETVLGENNSNESKAGLGKDSQRLRLQVAPHLTLYQLSLPVAALPQACADLRALAGTFSAIEASATEVVFNSAEGSLEQRYLPTDVFTSLQERVIECLNVARGTLLLERDPAGNTRSIARPVQVDGDKQVS